MDVFAIKLIRNGQTIVSNYLLSNFAKLNMTPDELVMYLQLKRCSNEGIKMPSDKMLSSSTGFSKNQVDDILHEMIQKKFMSFKTTYDKDHHSSDEYDFSLLYKKLDQLSHSNRDNNDNWKLNQISRTDDNEVTASARERVFNAISKEFGRDLSGIEAETIDDWIKEYPPKMIILALKEAVLSQVYNLRYISKVLNTWEALNITTPQALQTYKKKSRHQFHHRLRPSNDKKGPHIPIFKI